MARRVDEGQRCKAERSERQDEIVSEDRLRDERGVEAKRRREVFLKVGRDFARSELRELPLVYFDKYRRVKY